MTFGEDLRQKHKSISISKNFQMEYQKIGGFPRRIDNNLKSHGIPKRINPNLEKFRLLPNESIPVSKIPVHWKFQLFDFSEILERNFQFWGFWSRNSESHNNPIPPLLTPTFSDGPISDFLKIRQFFFGKTSNIHFFFKFGHFYLTFIYESQLKCPNHDPIGSFPVADRW